MIVGESPWHALEHRAVVEHPESPPRPRVPYNAGEPSGVLRYGVANFVQRWARRHPDPRADERLAGLEVEVEPGTALLGVTADAMAGVAVTKPACRVRLVRRLVL